MQPQITRASWAMVATLGLVWGATFLVIELALEGITPFWLAGGRVGFAAGLMVLVWGLHGWALFGPMPGARPKSARPWVTLCVIGALSSAIPFMLISWGQQYVTSGFAGVSMAAVALMVLPLAHFLVPGEALTARKALGFVVGFSGVVVLIGSRAFESSGADMETAGRLAILAAAGCYAISSVLVRRLPPIDPIGLSTVLLLVGAAIVIPAAWVVEGPPASPPTNALIAVVVLGLIPTAGANLLRVLVIRSAGPTFMSLTNYQVPLWSVVFGALVLDEQLPPSLLWALVLILGGVGLSQKSALGRLFAN